MKVQNLGKRLTARIGCLIWLMASLLTFSLGLSNSAVGQMIAIGTPFNTASHSFYERQGVGFQLNLPGSRRVIGLNPNGQPTADGTIPFRFGGLGTALPPFGGYDPSADATFGIGILGRRGGSLGLNFAFGQGSSQTITSTVPSIVIMNGATGSVTDTSLRPFVTSVIPVVGEQWPAAPAWQRAAELPQHPVRPERQRGGRARMTTADNFALPPTTSSAEIGEQSVAAIRRQRLQMADQEIDKLLEQARQAAADGKPASAKIFYRNAARRAQGSERHSQILQEYREFFAD